MKRKKSPMDLGARERQIMSFLYKRSEATAAEVMEGISDPPTYSGVRAMLRILEEKGHVIHRQDGAKYIYRPTLSPDEAERSALGYMVQAFFNGSADRVVTALLDLKGDELSDDDLDRLAAIISRAKQQEGHS